MVKRSTRARQSTATPLGPDELAKGESNQDAASTAPEASRPEGLRGFDPDYADIVDYTVRSMQRIWEEKNVGLIYTHYLHNAAVHTSYGLSYGREEVVAGAVQMQVAFPDRRIHTEDVIWTGNPAAGFHTSHRSFSIGRNAGWSIYGPPTGTTARFRAIAECLVKENRVCEEWQVCDEMALVRSLGLDVDETVQRLIEGRVCPPYRAEAAGSIERLQGQTTPAPAPDLPEGPFDVEAFVRRTMHEIWNWRMFGKVHDYYAPAFRCHTVNNDDYYGQEETITWYQSLIGALPDVQMFVDDVHWQGSEAEGYRVSTRWNLVGTHAGHGRYGAPTGRRVRLPGISQQQIRAGRYVEEWMLFNEIALLCQLRAPEA